MKRREGRSSSESGWQVNHIPGAPKRGFLTSKWFVEIVSSVPPVVVSGIAAYRLWGASGTEVLGYLSGTAAAWLVVASGLKVASAYNQDKADTSAKDHRDLRAALHVLHATAAVICKLDLAEKDAKLRVTFHRVVPPVDQPEDIEQIVDYVGGSGNGSGREFSIRSGVTGKAVRERSVYAYHRVTGDDAAYKKELKESWGYTDKDLKHLTEHRLSAIAVPVIDATGSHALGVIYFDSTEKSLFREKRRQAAIVAACSGLSKYISERYST